MKTKNTRTPYSPRIQCAREAPYHQNPAHNEAWNVNDYAPQEKKSKNITDTIFDRDQDEAISVASKEDIDDESGAGYMGWKSSNDDKNDIMKAFDEIRMDIQEIKKEEVKKSKQIKNL